MRRLLSLIVAVLFLCTLAAAKPRNQYKKNVKPPAVPNRPIVVKPRATKRAKGASRPRQSPQKKTRARKTVHR